MTGRTRRHRSQPPSEDQLAAISDLCSLAAALCFPGAATRLDAGATPPCLIICHPQAPQPQHITAEGDYFCWHHPTGVTCFGVRCLPIDLSAGAAAVLLAYRIAEQPRRPDGGPRGD